MEQQNSSEPNTAHDGDWQAERFAPTTWRPAKPPEPLPHTRISVGSLGGCSFCGSLSCRDMAAALKAGARINEADRKYGWPAKFYVDDVPNPHVGLMETTSSGPGVGRVGEPRPAPATTHGKFYTLHLKDATEAERIVIERAMRLHFEFGPAPEREVRWSAFVEPTESAAG
jgi:hypothetical protein